METFNVWLGMLVGSFFLTAMCMVMLGQPIRPISHLMKATTFWYLVTWIALAIVLALVDF
ncbi:MAG: hypothetical protein KC410_12715 [Anaerolineales bacterium]|nr:hypothetical protein [Anaerolineales bacterium]